MKKLIIIVCMAFSVTVGFCQDKSFGFANYLLDVKQKAEFHKSTFDSTANNYDEMSIAYTQVKNNQKKLITLFLIQSLQNRNLTKELIIIDDAFNTNTFHKLKYANMISNLDSSLNQLLQINATPKTSNYRTFSMAGGFDGISAGLGLISSGVDLYQKIADINKDRKMALLDIIKSLEIE